ncbi:conjugal transfer protein TrbD [Acidiphilium sp. PM]|uniref:conjugal transfer protein TrbD n=1 Tax=Acidiphilium sp. PM TaxID=1043206 RepID=UPI0005880147
MIQREQTRRIPIHSSLLRPHLLAGGERALTMLNATFAAVLIFGVETIPAILTGIVVFILVQTILVMMAKRDPQMFDTYKRHIHHKRFYPAQAWLHAIRREPRV